MLRRIAKIAIRRDKDRYWSDMVFRKETAGRLGDNKKLFHLLYKAIIIQKTINEMVCLLRMLRIAS